MNINFITSRFPRAVVRCILNLPLACALTILTLSSGCCTKCPDGTNAKGMGQIYLAGYDTVWTAALGAGEMDDLTVVKRDKTTGHILAVRGIGLTTFGERVNIWVRPAATGTTSVQVVSRHMGPPVLDYPNWEKPVLEHIATMVDVETTAQPFCKLNLPAPNTAH